MNILQSLILGVVEGLTEFLPISSTFHLIWTAKLLNIPSSEFLKTFNIVIQSGAILAVVIMYAKEIFNNKKLFINLLVSFIPTALIGLLFYDIIKNNFLKAT
jgi:undecaprenyl-diphosphatase